MAVTVEKQQRSVTVTKTVTRPAQDVVVQDPERVVTEQDVNKLVVRTAPKQVEANSFIGPPGPAGPSGTEFSPYGKSPVLTYSGNLLTRIDYVAGDYKTLTYTGQLLTQVVWIRPDVTITKVLQYAGNQLISVTETVV